jgi:threonine synthase
MNDGTFLASYRCTLCRESYSTQELIYLCPVCSKDYQTGYPLRGVLEAWYDYQAIADLWRVKPDIGLFSPVSKKYYPEIPVGDTPFYRSYRLGETMGLEEIWVKNDSLNPSGSLKDRASMVIVAEAKRLGIQTIVTASTGNAASALAAIAASAGIKAVIFVPKTAPRAKLKQIEIHGAELHKVDGDYDKAFAESLAYSKTSKALNRNTAYHPLTIEGKKTAGLEIFIQNEMRVPQWIIVPTGDGVILAGIYKAFIDLKRTGLISMLPRLMAVQSETSAAIADYWRTGSYANAEKPDTLADSISVKAPSNAYWAKRILDETDGIGITVSDGKIRKARAELASLAGIFAEPASAAAYAGLKKASEKKLLSPKEQVVLLVTGHGLKDS